MSGWEGITQLLFQAADKAAREGSLEPWRGEVPVFADLRWEGGRYGPVRKPYLPEGEKEAEPFEREFQRAIELEKRDR